MENLHKIAFEETDTAIFMSDPCGQCLAVNPRAISLTGYAEGELVGKEIFSLIQSDVQSPLIHRDGFPKGKSIKGQGRLRRKDGGLLAVEFRVLKLPDGNLLETVRDITAQKKENEALRKNEELFRIAFDHAPTGMSIVAPDGRTYLAVNPLLCEMFGYNREEFLGETIQLVTHPDDEAPSNEWIRKKISGEPCESVLEKRYLHRDGHTVWGLVSAHWIKNDDGSNRMAIAHIQDITKRKEAEEERKSLQAQLAFAMELARLGHWEYNVGSDTFTFNDHFYRIFRTTAQEVGGYTMSSSEYAARFLHPEDRQLIAQEIRKVIETPDPDYSHKIEHRILYADGKTGYISVHCFAEKDQQGLTIKAYGINQDITDRKLAEEERRKLQDHVRQTQKMESIGQLAGGVAHDFNNLLTPILGYTDILKNDLAEGDRRQMQLGRIRHAAERAKAVAQRLLAFSRKQLLELKTVDLREIISKFEHMLRRTIRENIEITIQVLPDLCLVKADPVQIEQVLLNLSINAQDAMPDGGRLMIEIDHFDLDAADIAGHRDIQPGAYAVLSVRDSGIGIDDEVMAHIFEPYYTTKEPGRGTGLGLSTVYGIVKQHEGSISVSSEKGQGTTFKIFLPQSTQKSDKRIEEAPHRPGNLAGGQETILVVEDDEMVRSLACDMLNELGYSVLVAEDPGQGIELVKEHRCAIHLLLTDIIMPKMNGKELYDVLNDLQPDLKVVFMSGYASNILGDHNIFEKDTRFIRKPFSMHELSVTIRQALDAEPTSK